jgi:cell wall-associated NlpC family hydrolase
MDMGSRVVSLQSSLRAAVAVVLACALCAAALALTPAAADADPAKVLTFGKGDLASLRAQAADVRAQIDRLDRKAQEAVERYDAARTDLDQVSARLTEVRRELGIAQSRLDRAQLVLSERLASMYKSDALTLLDVLLAASDFADIGTQLDYFRLVNQADQANLDDISSLTSQVARLTDQLEEDRAAALEKETLLNELRADVEDQLAQRQELLAGVNDRIGKILARQRAAAEAAARRLAGDLDLDSITGTDAQLAAIRETMRWLGVPYVWGGAGPRGFDCSGLVLYVFAKFGVKLPHAATSQARMGTPVPFGQLQPADLVFFGSPSFYHHVGIYVGEGKFIEAPHTGDVVKVSVLAGRGATLACRYPLRLP